jgi:hypothetical protein
VHYTTAIIIWRHYLKHTHENQHHNFS